MKKIELITFIFITLVIGTVVASCSGSSTQTGTSNYPLNPTNTPNEETFSLVGVWKYEWGGVEPGYSLVSLFSDGSYISEEWLLGNNEYHLDSWGEGKYTYNASTKIFTISDDEGFTNQSKIVWLSALSFRFEKGEGEEAFVRVSDTPKKDVTSYSIVGTWCSDKEQCEFIFLENGEYQKINRSSNGSSYEEVGQYKIYKNILYTVSNDDTHNTYWVSYDATSGLLSFKEEWDWSDKYTLKRSGINGWWKRYYSAEEYESIILWSDGTGEWYYGGVPVGEFSYVLHTRYMRLIVFWEDGGYESFEVGRITSTELELDGYVYEDQPYYDNDVIVLNSALPTGSYIEEDGDESELFTLVVNGENIFMIVTVYGQVVGAHEFTYNLDGDVITLHPRANDSLYDEMETAYFDKNSGRITWDGITYILGSVYPLW